MDIEKRLREIMTVEDPGVQVTDAVMSRLGEWAVPDHSGAPILRLSDARARRRRFIVAGTLVAATAAAAMLVVQMGGKAPRETQTSTAVIPSVRAPDASMADVTATASPVKKVAPPPLPLQAPVADFSDLPLLPPPRVRNTAPTVEMMLMKAVERHPELVEGPAVEGERDIFVASLVMRANGTVLSSAARLARPEEFRAVRAELDRMLPNDAGYGTHPTTGFAAKHGRLTDGRALRASVSLSFCVVPDQYDVTRSGVKVDQLMRARHPELFLPAKAGDINRVIAFLTQDGNIEREKVELLRVADLQEVSPTNLQEAERVTSWTAERIASRLGINIEQIGAMGNLFVTEGSLIMQEDAEGRLRPDDQRQVFQVIYAWPRREGESAPSISAIQIDNPATAREMHNTPVAATQLILAERVTPDAFTRRNSDAGTPVIALDSSGRIIGTMRVNTRGDEIVPSRATIRELQQLDPRFGTWKTSYMTATLKNKNGRTAEVTFAWLDSPREPEQTN